MSDPKFARTFPPDRLQATTANTPHRTTHGGCAWSLPSRTTQSLRQPQDGALVNAGSGGQGLIRAIDSRAARTLVEAEDARLSGSLRSLARRVMGLNVMHARTADTALTQSDRYFAEPTTRKTPETGRTSRPARTQVA